MTMLIAEKTFKIIIFIAEKTFKTFKILIADKNLLLTREIIIFIADKNWRQIFSLVSLYFR
jgi:hypothetical protein